MDSIDKFGRHLKKRPATSAVFTTERANLLELNSNGDYDFKNKRLRNVQLPLQDFDVANKKYVNTVLQGMDVSQLKERIDKFEFEYKKLDSRLTKVVNDNSRKIKILLESSSNTRKQLTNLRTDILKLQGKLSVAEQGNEQHQARPRQRTT